MFSREKKEEPQNQQQEPQLQPQLNVMPEQRERKRALDGYFSESVKRRKRNRDNADTPLRSQTITRTEIPHNEQQPVMDLSELMPASAQAVPIPLPSGPPPATPMPLARHFFQKVPALPEETPVKQCFSDELRKVFLSVPEQQRGNIVVVGVQHLLGTTASMFEELRGVGIKHFLILGKCYSSNEDVIKEMQARGINVRDSTLPPPGYYEEYFKQDIEQLIQDTGTYIQEHGIKDPLILYIDDGGRLILADHHDLAKYRQVAIEQTTAGHRLIKNVESAGVITPPWISVAASEVKKLEFSHIATAVAKQLPELFPQEVAAKPKLWRCAVIGYGNIGQAMVAQLQAAGHDVICYDATPNEQYVAGAFKKAASLEEALTDVDYVFECVGKDVFADVAWKKLSLRSGVHLVSTSSEDIGYRSLLCKYCDPTKQYGCHEDIVLQINDRQVVVPNRGWPVNFTGERHCVPAQYIAPTRTAIATAAYQLISTPSDKLANGEVVFDSGVQKSICDAVLAMQHKI